MQTIQSTIVGITAIFLGFPLVLGGAQVALATEALADQLEEVVVTARKREENLQNVPVSVAAISAAELKLRSLNDLVALGQATPNVQFGEEAQTGSASKTVFIRGVGQKDTLATFDPAVGIYIDGVYLGRMTGLDLDLTDAEQVEVLRGPQGTLFGKNTNGGAISIVTKKPDVHAQTPEGRVQFTGGSFNRFDATADTNIPLSPEKAALRFYVSRQAQNGYSTRIDGGQQANKDQYSGRMTLLVKPSENFDAFWSVDGTTYNQGASAFKLVKVRPGASVPMLYAAFTPDRYDNRWLTGGDFSYDGTGPNVNDGKLWGTALTLAWRVNSLTLKSITSYRRSSIRSAVDSDGSPLSVVNIFENVQQHQFAQEFQGSGEALDDRLKWVFGLYYFSEFAQDDDLAQVALEIFHGAANAGYDLGIKNESYSGYGQGTYSLTDRLNLTAGGRLNYDHKRVDRVSTGQTADSPKAGWTSFLPRVGLDYHWTGDFMTYLSAAEGDKSGGFNGRAAALVDFNRFDPEQVWTYELGLRSDWLAKRLRLNATAFYSRYKDMQIAINSSVTDPTTGAAVPLNIIGNIPLADIRGGELELTAIPYQHLRLEAGLGLADGKYITLLPGTPMTLNDAFVNTPKVTFTLAAEYETTVADRYDLTGRVDYIHKSRIDYDYANSSLVAQQPHGLLNARLALSMRDTGLSVGAFATNLTNVHYSIGGYDDGPTGGLGTVLRQMAPPREWGADVEYRF